MISMQDWYKFYEILLTKERIEFIEEVEQKMESTNLTVSDIYLDTVLKNVKSGKSPGVRNINLALIKYGRNVLTQVTKLLNKILQGDVIPQDENGISDNVLHRK